MKNWNRNIKRIIVVINDLLISLFSVWAAFSIRTDQLYLFSAEQIQILFVIIPLFLPFFFLNNIYSLVFRYFEIENAIQIAYSCLYYAFFLSIITIFIKIDGIPRSIGIIQPIILFVLICASRIVASLIFSYLTIRNKSQSIKRTMIYGAGRLGVNCAKLINNKEYSLIGFIDDDKHKVGKRIFNKKIYNFESSLIFFQRKQVDELIISIPDMSNIQINFIKNKFKNFNIKIKLYSSIESSIFTEEFTLNNLDVLNQNIDLVDSLLFSELKNKKILVTGAGGSIGRELTVQLSYCGLEELIILDHSEINLYSIFKKIEDIVTINNLKFKFTKILSSLIDKNRLDYLIAKYKPHIVLHAAAYKHVNIIEENSYEAINNNVISTVNLVDSCIKHKCDSFVYVSTDKAVHPRNIMGASKRISEMYLQSLSIDKKVSNNMNISIVRFGNVLNSSGSVIPLFVEQIKNGGPVTVTHKNVTRYFMSIPQAAGLILQTVNKAKKGEIFVLDMGKPIKIYDLAIKLIKYYGFNEKSKDHPNGIEIKISGLSKGEKMHEELFIKNPKYSDFHNSILVSDEDYPNNDYMKSMIYEFEKMIDKLEYDEITSKIKTIFNF